MAILFSTEDILEMAIHLEEEGEKFYSIFSHKIEKEEIKKIFNFLSLEEKKHKETFKEIYNNIKKRNFFTAYPDDEANKYLHAWVSSQVFIDWDKILKEKIFISETEVIDLAISLEKDSLLFYYGISEYLTQESKDVLKEIISQEKSHWDQLITLKKAF
jgi:rubrerythrin